MYRAFVCGIDLETHYQDIVRITVSRYGAYIRARGLDPDDIVGDTVLAIARRNGSDGAFDPRRGSTMGGYIATVVRQCISRRLRRLAVVTARGRVTYTDDAPDVPVSGDLETVERAAQRVSSSLAAAGYGGAAADVRVWLSVVAGDSIQETADRCGYTHREVAWALRAARETLCDS